MTRAGFTVDRPPASPLMHARGPRHVVIDVDHPAAAEADWLARLETGPALELPRAQRVVVVSPHPDDETLALGGTLQRLVANGCDVEIALCTDGDASHPGARGLGDRRWSELQLALHRLGLSDQVVVHRLAFGDGQLMAQREALADRLRPIVLAADLCISPLEEDGHPDHEAAAWAATAAAGDAPALRRWWYPVWAWHWMTPSGARFLDSARRVDLDREARIRKAHAIRSFASQLTSIEGRVILPSQVVAHFLRPFDTIVIDASSEGANS